MVRAKAFLPVVGLQRSVHTRVLKLILLGCRRIDVPFAQHLEEEGLEFLQFAFRYSP